MKMLCPCVPAVIIGFMLFQISCKAPKVEVRTLGSVDGTAITEEEVRREIAQELDNLELKRLQADAVLARNEHELLEKTLDSIINAKLAGLEAEKRGISKEELFDKEVLQKVAEPAAGELEAFYEANKDRIPVSREDAAPQIINFLKQKEENRIKEEFLAGLAKGHDVVRALEPLRYEVDAPGRPSKGPASAPVVLVEFSDFQCSYCRALSRTLNQVVEKYGDKVRLVFRQYPLSGIHPDARRAAAASLCAAGQGRFWEMHDQLFDNPEMLQEEGLVGAAERIGLDAPAFRACLNAGGQDPLIREDLRAGAAAGIEGTPTLFINGRYLNGNRPYEEIAGIIDEELSNTKTDK